MPDEKRYAFIGLPAGDQERLERYLPGNYRVAGRLSFEGRSGFLIEGRDDHGWTLDDYVLPRLSSGLIGGRELRAEQVAEARLAMRQPPEPDLGL
jgi:hypothetical protein